MAVLRVTMPPTDLRYTVRAGRNSVPFCVSMRAACAAAMATVVLMASAGCGGYASVHMIPLSSRKISMTKPLLLRVEPDECYYWLNDRQELCIAMRWEKRSIFGAAFEREFALSLVLPGPPAGWGRQYRVDRRTLRMRVDAGFSHTRAASLAGLVAVWDYDKKKLRGRFRISAKQQSYSVLIGWAGDTRILFVGEFTALPNRQAVERILAQTEEGKLARPRQVIGAAPERSGAARIACSHVQHIPASPVSPDVNSSMSIRR